MPKVAFIRTKYYSDYESNGEIVTPHEWEDVTEEELAELRGIGIFTDDKGYHYYLVEQASVDEVWSKVYYQKVERIYFE